MTVHPTRARFDASDLGSRSAMILRWVWRTVALFFGRKAWAAYQRHRDQQRYAATTRPQPPR